MNKRLAIIQSNYIPWKGYFDIINTVDEFIIYDTVQYTKNDWRNRNKIKTHQGAIWLTIPVQQTLSATINEIETINQLWRKKHWNSIAQAYSKAPYFKQYKPVFESLYLGSQEKNLSAINQAFIHAVCSILGITTKISNVSDFELKKNDRTEKLIELCALTQSSTYVSGLSAQSYLEEDLFNQKNLSVEWASYSNYPEYPQLHGDYVSEVSVLDLIFNLGDNAFQYMKSFQKQKNEITEQAITD